MKRPAFMEGAVAVTADAMRISDVDPKHIRNVSWMPSAPEPALPELKAPPVAPVAPPVVPPPAPVQVFVPMASSPPPEPPRQAERESVRLAITALKLQGERLAEQARSDALELGIIIARRILEQELTANFDAIFPLIKSAIRRAGEDHVTRIRLHPDDVAHVESAARSDFSLGKIELTADPTLTRGDVMVDTEHHSIDGRLATRFEEVVRQLGAQP